MYAFPIIPCNKEGPQEREIKIADIEMGSWETNGREL